MDRTNRVLLLDTGASGPGDVGERLAALSQFHDPAMPAWTTPVSHHGRRIEYAVQACADDVVAIGRAIEAAYAEFDAFVVLHRADTLAYAAAALSFMLEDLGKAVILTVAGPDGQASRPSGPGYGEGFEDLFGALTIAGHYAIPEVCVHSRDRTIRGNRAQRVAAPGRPAFTSGEFPALVQVGHDVRVEWERILGAPARPLRVLPVARRDVAALRLFPGMAAEAVTRLLQPPLAGAVLDGADSLAHRADFLASLRAASDRGLVLVLVSQGQHGARDDPALAAAGVIDGGDMTPEAALAKLCHLLGRYRDRGDVGRLMRVNLRGELTAADQHNRFSFRERVFIAAVARALAEAGESVTRVDVERALFPVLLCAAGGLGDATALERLLASGADVDAADYDGRTALHLAAAEGRAAAALLLLGKGARVDVADRWGGTPLRDAVRHGRHEVVTVLVRHGARLAGNFAAELCALAASGDLERLGLWIEAGVDLRAADYDGRTAIHIAAAEGRLDVLRLLLACGADPHAVDRWGNTPIHEARRAGHAAAAELLATSMAP